MLSAGGSDLWYGMGLVAGSFTGFTIAYFRLRFMERHMDEHIFCGGQPVSYTHLGELSDGKMYALLANTSAEDAGMVVERFRSAGFPCRMKEEMEL